jgi:hypothetical protein
LVVPDADLQLGRVYETSSYAHSLHFTNTADRSVTIKAFHTTCDCINITPEKDVEISPKETKIVHLALKLLSGQVVPPHPGGEHRNLELTAAYLLAGEALRTTSWRLNCTIVPTIQPQQTRIWIGMQSELSPVIQRSVDINATGDIAWIDCEAREDWSARIDQLQPAQSPRVFRLTVRSRGQLSPRRISDVIRLTPMSRQNERLAAKEIRLEGEIVRDVVAVPTGIYHGRRSQGTAAIEAISLRSLLNRKFRVRGLRPLRDDVEAAHAVDTGDDPIYSITTRFLRPGDQKTAVEFTIQDESGVEYAITVPVCYHGVRPGEGP